MTFASAVDAPRLDPSLVGERCDWNAWVGESDNCESWSWGACAELVVCTLVRRVVSACEWGGMLAGTERERRAEWRSSIGVTMRGARRGRVEEDRRGEERREEMRGETRPRGGGQSSKRIRAKQAHEGRDPKEHGRLK